MSVQLQPHFCFNWRKSSYSADQGNCVEIASRITYVLVRDAKVQEGPAVKRTAAQWKRFLTRIRI
jgi:hypothetical protein